MANLDEQIAAEEAALAAVRARMTDADREELAKRDRIAATREQRREEERNELRLALARREEAVREKLGDDVKLAQIEIEGHEDTYIIAHDETAYRRYTAAIARKSEGKKIDREGAIVEYAVAVVHDWNGLTDWHAMVGKTGNTAGAALRAHLKANLGQATAIVNEAVELGGLLASARKSTG